MESRNFLDRFPLKFPSYVSNRAPTNDSLLQHEWLDLVVSAVAVRRDVHECLPWPGDVDEDGRAVLSRGFSALTSTRNVHRRIVMFLNERLQERRAKFDVSPWCESLTCINPHHLDVADTRLTTAERSRRAKAKRCGQQAAAAVG